MFHIIFYGFLLATGALLFVVLLPVILVPFTALYDWLEKGGEKEAERKKRMTPKELKWDNFKLELEGFLIAMILLIIIAYLFG